MAVAIIPAVLCNLPSPFWALYIFFLHVRMSEEVN